MTEAQVIALLQDPKTLLRRCYLVISGGATCSPKLPNAPPPPPNGQAVTATFKVKVSTTGETVKGFTTGLSGFVGKEKDRPKVRIAKQIGPAKVVLAADEFNAYYIPMVQTSDVANQTSHYTLPTGMGALDTVITSQLSGCTFGVGSDGHGAVLVSHVQPNGATANLVQRATDLNNAVAGGFHAMNGRFEKGQEYSEYGMVIGHRTGTEWKFYLQVVNSRGTRNVVSKLEVID